MDHTTVQSSELAASPKEVQNSIPPPAQLQQLPPHQQSVHAVVHRLSPHTGNKDHHPQTARRGSSKYTNSSVGSTLYSLSPGSPAGGSSPYLTPPFVEEDEPPPFKPDKEDHTSLCMYEGPHSHDSEGGQRLQNRQGHPALAPVVAPRKRSERSQPVTGFTEPGQGARLIEAKHNEIQEFYNSLLFITTSPLHSSPSTLIQDDSVDQGLVAVASPVPSPVQGALPWDRPSSGDFPPHGTIFNRRRSLGAGVVPVPSFLRSLDTFYARGDSTSREMLEGKNKKALETRNGQENGGDRKQGLRKDRHKSVPDTPATITLRRASTVTRSDGTNVGDAHRMLRQRQDDLQDSMNTFFVRKSGGYGIQGTATSFNGDVEESLNRHPPSQLLPDGTRARKTVYGAHYRPVSLDVAPQRRASGPPEWYLLADRSRFAEPVTTYTASSRANSLTGGQGASSNELRRPYATIQNVQSSSSVYEVIWKDDYTPSDFRVERRDKNWIPPTKNSQTEGGGAYHSDSSWSGATLGSPGKGTNGHAEVAGWSWTRNSRRDSTGTRVQFGFESKSDSARHHTGESSGSLATSRDPMDSMESFPPLPERKSTLEWRTPNITETGNAVEAGTEEHTGLYSHATAAEVEVEHTLDQHPGCGGSDMEHSAPDPLDPAHSSDRGRPSHRSCVVPHPCARPRTADEPKMGFALGISAGLRRKANRSSASLTGPSPPLRSRSSRIQHLKDETSEVAPTILPAGAPVGPGEGPTLARTPSRLSGGSTPQPADEAEG